LEEKELTGDKQVLALENSMVFSWNFLVMDKQMCQAVGNSISSLVVEWSSCSGHDLRLVMTFSFSRMVTSNCEQD